MASIACPNCQTVAPEGTASCPGCGTPLSGATHAASSTPPPAAPPPSAPTFSAGSPKPQIKFDLKSVGRVDRLVAGGSLILFIGLFLPWFKVDIAFITVTASGLTAHGYLYITLILALAIVAFVAAETLGLWKLPATSQLSRDQLLLVATVINFILVLIAFLFKPGGRGVGWDWGAFVALAAAVVAVFPLGWPIIQARRGK
jgi:hypothetical protein